jgi:hypothetical protein
MHLATHKHNYILDILKQKPQLITHTSYLISRNLRIFADFDKCARYEFNKPKKQLIIIGFNKKVLARVTFNAVEFELFAKLKKYFEMDRNT